MDGKIAKGQFFWRRWEDESPHADVFNKEGEPSYKEARQGYLGNCYVIASAASIAEHPELIKDSVLVKKKNKAGIYGFKIYIRGIPWVVSIDDNLLYQNPSKPELVFAKEDHGVMWGALFEKTWAKVKGSYAMSEGGFIQTMLSTFTGAPIFSYNGSKITDQKSADTIWNILFAGYESHYIMGGAVQGDGDDTKLNSCGMAKSHAYSILAAFKVVDKHKVQKFLLVRNPWGTTKYNSDWSHDDPRWTPFARSQVPLGIDITTAYKQGIFALPMEKLINGKCMDEVSVVHYRKKEGYSDSRYDAIAIDSEHHDYTVHVPEKKGDLYFSLHTYPEHLIPEDCHTYSIQDDKDGSYTTYKKPFVYIDVKRGSKSLIYELHEYQFSRPIVLFEDDSADLHDV